ncbi:kinase-like domain-containing protein [Aspergillus coremiiformis]|uniref:Mitogen-activated protein kinase n=1 Tax=Aspergillus coremiiformis TaxID=138285 RepID=A0A5N6YVH5_9EURO|nr:kinase-like domain-containing protein [Aspergillus coremiiformis]
MEFIRAEILGTMFETTTRYANVQPVGLGAFGLVCSAYDQITLQHVAVKKMMNPFANSSIAKRTYREVKLLKQLRHENLIRLCDIFISPLEDIVLMPGLARYLVTELLGTDLSRLLWARPLDNKFAQYFMYQILRGLKYIHSAGVIHRDLKPSNLLVNENCDLKICDFGLARVQEPQMTGYVSTRYYRAPEIMLTWQRYSKMVDIWSAGCILAEMLRGRPLFPGKDHIHQFYLITEVLGHPPQEVVQKITSGNVSVSLRSCRMTLIKDLRGGSVRLNALLEQLLLFDPDKRLTAENALLHPYLAPYHDPDDEPVAPEEFDWSFNDADLPSETWKLMIYSEVLDYHRLDSTGTLDLAPGIEEPNFYPTFDFLQSDL